jgi:hypothetical protein
MPVRSDLLIEPGTGILRSAYFEDFRGISIPGFGHDQHFRRVAYFDSFRDYFPGCTKTLRDFIAMAEFESDPVFKTLWEMIDVDRPSYFQDEEFEFRGTWGREYDHWSPGSSGDRHGTRSGPGFDQFSPNSYVRSTQPKQFSDDPHTLLERLAQYLGRERKIELGDALDLFGLNLGEKGFSVQAKRLCRRAIGIVHPDKNPNDAQAEERTRVLIEAFLLLQANGYVK